MVALTAAAQIKGWNWALVSCRRCFNQLTKENSCELWYRSHTGLVCASKAFSVHSDKKTKPYQFCTRKSTRWRDVWSAVLTARWRAVSPSSWEGRAERNAVIRPPAASLSRNPKQLSRAFPFSNSLRHGQLMHTYLIKDCQKSMIPHLNSCLLSSFAVLRKDLSCAAQVLLSQLLHSKRCDERSTPPRHAHFLLFNPGASLRPYLPRFQQWLH